MKNIIIVGGGFSGTIIAVNLIRFSSIPLQISIINKSPLPCRGIAYATRSSSHLLNVVARNMSALADQPNHFVEWLATRSEYLEEPTALLRERFAPRKIYGDYLHNLFQWYAKTVAVDKKIQVECIQDEVSDVLIDGQQASVTLESGQILKADKVVMAAGNQTPADFRLRGLDVHSPKYIGNPWRGWEEKLPAKHQDVFLIGTGLTMVDTFLTLQDLGWQGKIFAVSRNGLLPRSHFKGFEYPDILTDAATGLSLAGMFALFKRHYRATEARHLNPAIIVDKLRPHTQRLWQGFSLVEKKRFNRLCRTRWNVIRHRIAPEIHQHLSQAIAENRLEVIRGRLSECEESDDQLKITIQSQGIKRVINAGVLINCTGPQESYAPSKSVLFNQLLNRGTVLPDEMNMGIKVAPDFAVLDGTGKPSPTLFAMGALLKGTLWESIAVPELRSQAFRLAQHLAGQLAENIATRSPISEVVQDVMEYSI